MAQRRSSKHGFSSASGAVQFLEPAFVWNVLEIQIALFTTRISQFLNSQPTSMVTSMLRSTIGRWINAWVMIGVAGFIAFIGALVLGAALLVWLSDLYGPIIVLCAVGGGLVAIAAIVIGVALYLRRRARLQAARIVAMGSMVRATPLLMSGVARTLQFTSRRPLTMLAIAASVGALLFVERNRT